MKKVLLIFLTIFLGLSAFAQQATVIDSKSMTVPRYADLGAIQAAITAPQTGMMVYNIATQTNWTYNGTAWVNTAGAGASQWVSGLNDIIYGGEGEYIHNVLVNNPIPNGTPNGPNGILNSTIYVPQNRNIINQNEVTITVKLIGQYNFETAIKLISPSGVEFSLFYPVQSPQKILDGKISINSAALSSIDFSVSTNDLTGTYLPPYANALEGLSGLNINGTWKLQIEDSYHSFGQMGTLVAWGIKFGDGKKVGIGTLEPQTTLDVYGDIKGHSLRASSISTSTLTAGSINSHLLKFSNLDTNKKLVLWDNNTLNDFEYFGLGINSGVLKYHVGNSLSDHVFFAGSQFQISGTYFPISNELFRIKGNGNIIFDPQNANDGSFTGNSLIFGPTGSGEGILSKRTAGGNQWGLDFLTASQYRLSIKNDGNVGIGTSNPTSTLEVNGSIAGKVSGNTQSASTTIPTTIGNTLYTSLNPQINNALYEIPAANTCPGRIMIFRNDGPIGHFALIRANGGGGLFDSKGNGPTSTLIVQPTIGNNKMVQFISDGSNWVYWFL